MDVTRILVAHGLTCYREAIAAALRELRPHAEVLEVEARDLNREVVHLRPDLVVCGQRTPIVEERCANWVELYSDSGGGVVVSIGRKDTAFDGITLRELLSIIDRVDRSGRVAETA